MFSLPFYKEGLFASFYIYFTFIKLYHCHINSGYRVSMMLALINRIGQKFRKCGIFTLFPMAMAIKLIRSISIYVMKRLWKFRRAISILWMDQFSRNMFGPQRILCYHLMRLIMYSVCLTFIYEDSLNRLFFSWLCLSTISNIFLNL